MRRRAALGLVALLPATAGAQQVLYEPQPPAGSAYLRVVNASAAQIALRPALTGPATLGTDAGQRISPYTVQEAVAGRAVVFTIAAGPASLPVSLNLEPGSFNTLLVVAEGAALRAIPVVDQTQFNQTRARLSFYNASSACAAGGLSLDPQGQAVFADLEPGTARMRSVNPVSAQVRVACAAGRSAPFALGGMEAGGQYSVWLMAPGGQPIGFMTRDTTTPWRR
jgi:hypothetical protein